VLHAVWNAIAHAVSDRLLGFALIGLAYVVVGGVARWRSARRRRTPGRWSSRPRRCT